LLKFPDKEKAMAKIRDLALLSDIFPTGYDGAYRAGVTRAASYLPRQLQWCWLIIGLRDFWNGWRFWGDDSPLNFIADSTE
jgi:hypothetical protein